MVTDLAPRHHEFMARGCPQKGLVTSGLKGLGSGLLYAVAIVVLSSLHGGLRAEYERAHHARGPSSAIDHA